jgi:hypothetical protein
MLSGADWCGTAYSSFAFGFGAGIIRAVDADEAEAIVAFRWKELAVDDAIGCLVSCSNASMPDGGSGRLTRRRGTVAAERLMLLELRSPETVDESDPDPLLVEKMSSS